MDLIDNLPLEMLDGYKNSAYDAGLAHGIISGSLIVLLLWMCCVQCNRPFLRRDRIREAMRML
jgi:hypothetical protein